MQEITTVPKGAKLIVAAVLLVVAITIILAINPFYQVDNGNVGILRRWKNPVSTLNPGIHVVWPIVNDVVEINIQTQMESQTQNAVSRDLQEVNTTVALNYNINASDALRIYQTLGLPDVVLKRIVTPNLQEATKATTAKYSLDELVSKRELVRSDIFEALKQKIDANSGLTLSNLSITNFEYSKKLQVVIEQKVEAEQSAQMEKNQLEVVRMQQEQKVITAKAEAEATVAAAKASADARVLQSNAEASAIRAQAAALESSPKFLELKKLDVQLELAKHWTGDVPSTVISGQGGTSPVVPFFELGK